MTTSTSTLADWLLAQIEADEAMLQRAEWPFSSPHDSDCEYPGDMPGACTCNLFGRLLAQCAAFRQIVEQYLENVRLIEETPEVLAREVRSTNLTYEHAILPALATIYADRDGFREEWRA